MSFLLKTYYYPAKIINMKKKSSKSMLRQEIDGFQPSSPNLENRKTCLVKENQGRVVKEKLLGGGGKGAEKLSNISRLVVGVRRSGRDRKQFVEISFQTRRRMAGGKKIPAEWGNDKRRRKKRLGVKHTRRTSCDYYPQGSIS